MKLQYHDKQTVSTGDTFTVSRWGTCTVEKIDPENLSATCRNTSTGELFDALGRDTFSEADLLARGPTTLPIPPHIARAMIRRQCQAGGLPESLETARQASLAVGHGPDENLTATITATRGRRIAVSIVPTNMLSNMLASEEKAWSHSPLAGCLWEHGFRASIACQLAETV